MEMDSLIKRRRIGKSKQTEYNKLFENLQDAKLIGLEQADEIIKNLQDRAKYNCAKEEFIDGNLSFKESNLLREVYLGLFDSDDCYCFTDGYEFCGLYLASAKQTFETVFQFAFKNETCFLLDKGFKYSFRINYYDNDHNDYPNRYDVRRSF